MNILMWDTGSAVNHALRFAKDGGVKYYNTWSKESPEFVDHAVGLGFPGVEKIRDFMQNVDWADLIVFCFNTSGDLCDYLRRTTDKSVFGAGLGEKLELDRVYLKKVQKEIGLDVQPYKIITGVDATLDYIAKSPDKFVKVSTYRGDLESFHAKKVSKARRILNVFRTKLGPFEDKFQFVVEDSIDSVVESGWDLFFNGEDYLRPYLWGYLKDNWYICKWSEELPEPLEKVADKLKPVLKKFGYRGAVSTEIIITKDGKVYLLDITCRLFMPGSILYTQGIDNYTEVFKGVADGEDVEIENNSEYMGCIDAKSTYNLKEWEAVDIPKGNDRIKVLSGAMVGNEVYSTPQTSITAVMLGYGDSVEDICDELNKDLGDIELYDSDVPELDERKVKEVIEAGESIGLEF